MKHADRMSAERLSEIRERTEKATPGPWSAADEHGLLGPESSAAWCVSRMRPGFESMGDRDVDEQGRRGGYLYDIAEIFCDEKRESPDAEFIAHAREDIPDLLTEIAGMRAKIARVEALLNRESELPMCLFDGTHVRPSIMHVELQEALADPEESQ